MCSVHFVWRQETAIIARVNAIIISRLFGVGSRQLFGLNVCPSSLILSVAVQCSLFTYFMTLIETGRDSAVLGQSQGSKA